MFGPPAIADGWVNRLTTAEKKALLSKVDSFVSAAPRLEALQEACGQKKRDRFSRDDVVTALSGIIEPGEAMAKTLNEYDWEGQRSHDQAGKPLTSCEPLLISGLLEAIERDLTEMQRLIALGKQRSSAR